MLNNNLGSKGITSERNIIFAVLIFIAVIAFVAIKYGNF